MLPQLARRRNVLDIGGIKQRNAGPIERQHIVIAQGTDQCCNLSAAFRSKLARVVKSAIEKRSRHGLNNTSQERPSARRQKPPHALHLDQVAMKNVAAHYLIATL